MDSELTWLDATAQAQLVHRGEVSPLELVDAAIERIERVNPELNAVITTTFERARSAAAAGDFPRGPFRGVPFLMKDLDACTANEPFHCGMRILREIGYRADHDAFLSRSFAEAGFLSLGKTNTPELGLTVTTEPESYGPSRNPWNTEYSTGGSSGGSAAAVAAGLVPAAHASDGGGSIRVPASECGLVGLKPSRGRVSLGPDYGEYWAGLVISHVVTRTVRDSAAILDAVCGAAPGDPYTAPNPARPYASEVGVNPGRLRVGLMARTPAGSPALDADCATAVQETGRVLEDLGHYVEIAHPAAMDEFAESTKHFSVIVSTWVASALGEWSAKIGRTITAADVEPSTWGLAELGRSFSAEAYVDTIKWIGGYTRRMAAWWGQGFDVLVTPTIAAPPPKLGYLGASPSDGEADAGRVLRFIPYTPAFNITGQPAVSLPLHWNADDLPIGVQLVAAYGREDLLLRVSAQLESAQPWRERRPPVHA